MLILALVIDKGREFQGATTIAEKVSFWVVMSGLLLSLYATLAALSGDTAKIGIPAAGVAGSMAAAVLMLVLDVLAKAAPIRVDNRTEVRHSATKP